SLVVAVRAIGEPAAWPRASGRQFTRSGRAAGRDAAVGAGPDGRGRVVAILVDQPGPVPGADPDNAGRGRRGALANTRPAGHGGRAALGGGGCRRHAAAVARAE